MSEELEVMRCMITNNPCGTDTRPAGCPCLCKTCVEWLATQQLPLESDYQKIIDDNYWHLTTSDKP